MNTHSDHKSEQTSRRQTERHRTLRHARIILNNLSSTFDCIIRNISVTGAMLEVPAPIGIPNKFELALDMEKHGPACTVRWRTDHYLGVSFDDAWEKAA